MHSLLWTPLQSREMIVRRQSGLLCCLWVALVFFMTSHFATASLHRLDTNNVMPHRFAATSTTATTPTTTSSTTSFLSTQQQRRLYNGRPMMLLRNSLLLFTDFMHSNTQVMNAETTPRRHASGKDYNRNDKYIAGISSVAQRVMYSNIRGGGGTAVGYNMFSVIGALLRTLIHNPLLVLLMMGSSAVVVYKDQVPYVKQVQGLLQFAIVGYVVILLAQWQQRQVEEADKK